MWPGLYARGRGQPLPPLLTWTLRNWLFGFQVASLREKLRMYEAGAQAPQQDLPQPPKSGTPQPP